MKTELLFRTWPRGELAEWREDDASDAIWLGHRPGHPKGAGTWRPAVPELTKLVRQTAALRPPRDGSRPSDDVLRRIAHDVHRIVRDVRLAVHSRDIRAVRRPPEPGLPSHRLQIAWAPQHRGPAPQLRRLDAAIKRLARAGPPRLASAERAYEAAWRRLTPVAHDILSAGAVDARRAGALDGRLPLTQEASVLAGHLPSWRRLAAVLPYAQARATAYRDRPLTTATDMAVAELIHVFCWLTGRRRDGMARGGINGPVGPCTAFIRQVEVICGIALLSRGSLDGVKRAREIRGRLVPYVARPITVDRF